MASDTVGRCDVVGLDAGESLGISGAESWVMTLMKMVEADGFE
jgi:hypothetical protein